MHPNVKDLTGKTFGKLLVVGPAPRPEGSKGRGQHWECFCECLQDVVVRSDSLVQGWATSCGCTNEHAAHARAAIKPRRTKSTVSEQPEQTRPKYTPEPHSNMSEKNPTYSNTDRAVPVPVATLKLVRTALRLSAPLDEVAEARDLLDALLRFSETPNALRELAEHERTSLRFAPAPLSLSKREHSHYFKPCAYDFVDVYRVLDLFGITDQAIGHALKKLLVAGGRGAGKDIKQDIKEAIDTLTRWQEMRREDEVAAQHYLSLQRA